MPPHSSVRRVGRPVGRDVLLVAVADRQQHVLGEVQVATLLAVVLQDVGLDDRIDRAAFFAEAAEDALGQVDVVALGAPRTVVAHLGLDRDGQRRADRLAQLAGDAALLAVLIPAQRVQAAEARRQRGLFLGELDRDLALEQGVPPRELHALEEFDQEERVEEVLEGRRDRGSRG
jgi:hypothetical protein